MQLKRNQQVLLRDGRSIIVTDRLGVGGQGIADAAEGFAGEVPPLP